MQNYAEKVRAEHLIAVEKKEFDYYVECLMQQSSGKSESRASELRKAGNQHFLKENYFEALKSYNECLCLAPPGSECLGLAFANRSAIFLKTGFFAFCLENIELALKSGYPNRLREKLLSRKEECLAAKEKQPDSEEVYRVKNPSQLSHPANPRIPFMIEGLKLAKNEEFGRHIVTSIDLKPGDVILLEEPYAKCLHKDFAYFQCTNCTSNNFFNLKPCPKATSVMFCSDKCATEAWDRYYKFEYSVTDVMFTEQRQSAIATLAYRLVFKAFTMFDDIQKLKDLVSSIDCETSFDVDFTKSESDQFRVFYNMANEDPQKLELVVKFSIFTWQVLKQSNEVKELLKNRDDEDLFLNLLVRFILIGKLNSNELANPFNLHSQPSSGNEMGKTAGSAISPIYSLFSHSCAPNIVLLPGTNRTYVTRPIKAGEQLFISYGPHYLFTGLMERQAFCKRYNFICKCEACAKNYPLGIYLPKKNLVPLDVVDYLEDLHQNPDLFKKEAATCQNIISKLLVEHDHHYPCADLQYLDMSLMNSFNTTNVPESLVNIFTPKPNY